MITDKQCNDHKWVIERLKECQEADHDMRERAREAQLFLSKRDGQWEPQWAEVNKDKPRYTFDLTTPIVDQVVGDLEQYDFDVKVTPSGGEASEDVAETYDGLVRNIENISGASHVYSQCARDVAVGGFSAWRIIQAYNDGDSFDQDLMIKRIPNPIDRVWFGPHNEPDASDADYCFVLSGMDPEEYKEKYPDRKSSSVNSDRQHSSFFHRNDQVMLGEFLYLKKKERELHLLTDGRVVDADEYASLADELKEMGVTIEKSRKRHYMEVYSRLFDTDGWVTEARPTVFRHMIPVVPMYGNFAIVEDKVTYSGVVEKLMDPQRVFNYSLSREIEEGALAPREKFMVTPNQIEGYESDWARMNVSADPYQIYNPDPQAPGAPQKSGGPQINPGLRNISTAMQQVIGQSAGMFAANMGDNPGLQSGKAIEALQDRGDRANNKFLRCREIAQEKTGKILVDAIPRIYGPKRQIRILGQDGVANTVTVGELVQDRQTGELMVLNDLSQGKYDVQCTSAPSFKTRQSETVRALTEIGGVDPTVIEIGGDVLLGNIPSPGMDEVAKRKRQQLFNAGLIPMDQMTEEELAQMEEAQNQEPEESPEMVLARAEEAKAQADAMAVQQKVQESQQEFQIKLAQLEIEKGKLEIDRYQLQIEAQKAGVDIKLKGAQAAKALAEAEAQDVETDAVVSGISRLMEASGGA